MPKLTDDELRAVRARVEAYERKLDGHWLASNMELEGMGLAREVPRLLAHADALAAEVARLRGDRRAMHDALLTLVSHIHMRAHPSNRMKWVCPYCKGTHKSLTALEEGEGHTESCPYAAARRALEGGTDETPLDYGLARGWQAYHEEYTDALGFLPCDGFGTKVYVVRDKEGRQMGFSQVSRQDAFQDAYEKAKRALEGGA